MRLRLPKQTGYEVPSNGPGRTVIATLTINMKESALSALMSIIVSGFDWVDTVYLYLAVIDETKELVASSSYSAPASLVMEIFCEAVSYLTTNKNSYSFKYIRSAYINWAGGGGMPQNKRKEYMSIIITEAVTASIKGAQTE